MLRHEYEIPGPSCTFNNSPSGKYLALRTLAHNDSGFVSSLHPCLASIARSNSADQGTPNLHSLHEYTIRLWITNASSVHSLAAPTSTDRSLC
jgi:hypothetical protein